MYLKTSLALIAIFFLGIPASALDFAKREIIGFSADGNFFAFEQYGSQDGSGYAYSDIFIINAQTDKWAPGSPYRYLHKDETETRSLLENISIARTISRDAAKDALSIISDPGIIAATSMVDENSPDPHQISIAPKSFFLPNGIKRMEFRVNSIELPAPQNCLDYDLGKEFVGFRLSRSDAGNSMIVMHEDIAIPNSRNCPLNYEPSDVVVHIGQDGKYSIAVLIRVQHLGFEGLDRRFIAVTGQLN